MLEAPASKTNPYQHRPQSKQLRLKVMNEKPQINFI